MDERHRVARVREQLVVKAVRDGDAPEQRVEARGLMNAAHDEEVGVAIRGPDEEAVTDAEVMLLRFPLEKDRAVLSQLRERCVRPVHPREVEEAPDRRGVEARNRRLRVFEL